MKKNFNCLIIGLGQIGMMYDYYKKTDVYLSHATSVLNLKRTKLYGAVDISKERRKLFTKKYRIKTFKNIKDIKKKNFDFIILSTPTKTHYNLIRNITTNFRIKVLLCEKPFTNNFKEGSKIYDITKKKFKIFVNYPRIIDPSLNILRNKIFKLSKIKGEVFYSKSLKNNGSHFINLFNVLFGKPISIKKIFNRRDVFLINFKNAEIKFTKKNKNKTNNFYLENKDLKIDYRYTNKNIFILKNKKKKIVPSFNNKINFHVIKNIEKFLLGEKVKLCTAKKALETLKIIKKIEEIN